VDVHCCCFHCVSYWVKFHLHLHQIVLRLAFFVIAVMQEIWSSATLFNEHVCHLRNFFLNKINRHLNFIYYLIIYTMARMKINKE